MRSKSWKKIVQKMNKLNKLSLKIKNKNNLHNRKFSVTIKKMKQSFKLKKNKMIYFLNLSN